MSQPKERLTIKESEENASKFILFYKKQIYTFYMLMLEQLDLDISSKALVRNELNWKQNIIQNQIFTQSYSI